MKVAILGGGQLARMLALAGQPMGIEFVFLDPVADACAEAMGKHLQGAFDDSELLEKLAKQADVVIFEFENVPATSVERLASNILTYPPAHALSVAQDRLKEKNLFRELDIPVQKFAAVNSLAELEAAVTTIGLPAVLKTRTQGYDGQGQAVLRQPEDTERAWQQLQGTPAVLEAFIAFERELSIIAVRGRLGDMAFYPVSENTHHEGILHFSVSRPDDPMQQRAEAFARLIAEALDYVGVLTLELFQAGDKLIANEIAPRVHNSGHWTIEGAETSQFENHLRAILGLPLGPTTPVGYSTMVNFIGAMPDPSPLLSISGVHLHAYGKENRPGRKVGHATLRTLDERTLQEKLVRLQTLTEIAHGN